MLVDSVDSLETHKEDSVIKYAIRVNLDLISKIVLDISQFQRCHNSSPPQFKMDQPGSSQRSVPATLPPPYTEKGELPPSYNEKEALPPEALRLENISQTRAPAVTVVEYAAPRFGQKSQIATCPDCGSREYTKIKTSPNATTHLFAIFILCLCWPCAWVPYATDSCQSVSHHCANCDAFLGEKDN